MKKHLLFAMLLLIATSIQAQTPKAETHSLKILYLFSADLSEAHESYVTELEEGEEYKVESPTISNFTPDKPVVEGKMGGRDIVDTVRYTAMASTTYEVKTQSHPEEGGSTSGGGTFEEGEECTVTASANDGYSFVNWTEDGDEVSNRTNYTFTVDRDRTLVANFEQETPAPITHTVSVSPLISHGSVRVSPSGEVEVGTEVMITAIPDEGYVLENVIAFNKDDVGQTVDIVGMAFVMPDFDVIVSASFEQAGSLPVIEGDIEAPSAICAGESLELQAPTVSDADEQEWQMSASAAFDGIVVYTGQALDASYDGWKLRYMASNALGEVYSNVVSISVFDFDFLTLSGEQSSCTGLECTYRLNGANQAELSWTVSDASAIVTETGSSIKVLWGTKGTQTVKVIAVNTESGCTAETEMEVAVQSYIDESGVNAIVAKKHGGQAYLLIYPNPKDTYKYQWYKDGEAIAGANGQYYYPANGLTEGEYQVYISYNADAQGNLFCGAFSPVLTVGGAKADFAVYPNPAQPNENLVVVNNTGHEAVLTVYSVDGRRVHVQTLANGSTPLTVALPQGVYMLQLSDGEDLSMQKVVIQ